MSTNYYRVPKHADVRAKQQKLLMRVKELDISPGSIERGFPLQDTKSNAFDYHNPWSEFIEGLNIHVGKRSSGWKFLWNFHNNKYYSNKEELLAFIRNGRIVDEYGKKQDVEEFIEMALNWCPDGLVYDVEQQIKERGSSALFSGQLDKNIDGLRVSAVTEFS